MRIAVVAFLFSAELELAAAAEADEAVEDDGTRATKETRQLSWTVSVLPAQVNSAEYSSAKVGSLKPGRKRRSMMFLTVGGPLPLPSKEYALLDGRAVGREGSEDGSVDGSVVERAAVSDEEVCDEVSEESGSR